MDTITIRYSEQERATLAAIAEAGRQAGEFSDAVEAVIAGLRTGQMQHEDVAEILDAVAAHYRQAGLARSCRIVERAIGDLDR